MKKDKPPAKPRPLSIGLNPKAPPTSPRKSPTTEKAKPPERPEKPAFERPDKPAFERNSFEKPTIEKPVVERPTIEKPAFERPAIDKSVFEKPTIVPSLPEKPVSVEEQKPSPPEESKKVGFKVFGGGTHNSHFCTQHDRKRTVITHRTHTHPSWHLSLNNNFQLMTYYSWCVDFWLRSKFSSRLILSPDNLDGVLVNIIGFGDLTIRSLTSSLLY